MRLIYIAYLLLFASISIHSEKKAMERNIPSTNLHDFMEDYTKNAMRYFKKTGDRSYLLKLLPVFPELALEDQKKEWQTIVDKYMNEGKPENSCKSCHDLFKKDYKKKYRKREIQVPGSIHGLDMEIERALEK